MTKNKFLALVYADIFDFSLTKEELVRWQIGKLNEVNPKLIPDHPQTQNMGNIYFLPRRERLVGLRRKREMISNQKLMKAEKLTKLIKLIPTIMAIYVTGSVAANNASRVADIDLMIITAPRTLWITRILMVSTLKVLGSYRHSTEIVDRFCTNIFLDMDNLAINNRNLFTAHEILQAKCLFDRSSVQSKWLETNRWTKIYLPVAYNALLKISSNASQKSNSILEILSGALFPLELIAFVCSIWYMKNKMTNEKVGWGYAFFHPNDLSETVLERFRQRLLKLSR